MSKLDFARAPYFSPYRSLIDGYCQRLNDPGWVTNFNERATPQIPLKADNGSYKALEYEQIIRRERFVPTRIGSLHDFFNAVVWTIFPTTKGAINVRHTSAGLQDENESLSPPNKRSRLRDALTLFDEVGLIVTGVDEVFRRAHEDHDWLTLFYLNRHRWHVDWVPIIVGHGLLESLATTPHRGLTAKALWCEQKVPTAQLDTMIAQQIVAATDTFISQLRPLPVFGVPQWSEENASEHFYADTKVFRPISKINV